MNASKGKTESMLNLGTQKDWYGFRKPRSSAQWSSTIIND